MFYQRKVDLKKILKQKSHFLLGPRSTGKSFWIKHLFPNTPYYDLLDNDLYQSLIKTPSTIRKLIDGLESKHRLIIIDEIQKVPALLDEVHRMIEEKQLSFLLTGSSARKLKRHSTNLLGGRAWMAEMFPLTYNEISNFDLLKYLNFGGLPHVYNSKYPKKELKNYINLYLKEEIQQEALIRTFEQFARFLDSAALLNAEEVNYSNWASDIGIPAKTLTNYIDLLKDTLLAFELHAYTKSKKRKAIQRSKFYFFDVGVANHLTNQGEIIPKSNNFGKAFEHFIIQEVRACNSYCEYEWKLCYWRSLSQFEVDLILSDQIAIEIKSATIITPKHLKGLKALREEGIIDRFIIVSLVSSKQVIDEIEIYPWKQFLDELWSNKICLS